MSTAAPSEQPGFAVNTLEAALRGPDGVSIGVALVAHIDALFARLATDMRSGIPAADFTRAKVISEGLIAAREVVSLSSINC
jgi:hypothetical protein